MKVVSRSEVQFGAVRLWDVNTGKVIAKWNMGHTDWPMGSVYWSQDGPWLTSSDSERILRWDCKAAAVGRGNNPCTSQNRVPCALCRRLLARRNHDYEY